MKKAHALQSRIGIIKHAVAHHHLSLEGFRKITIENISEE
jgi:hypothetical protein